MRVHELDAAANRKRPIASAELDGLVQGRYWDRTLEPPLAGGGKRVQLQVPKGAGPVVVKAPVQAADGGQPRSASFANIQVGEFVGINTDTDEPFWIGKVIEKRTASKKLLVHWYIPKGSGGIDKEKAASVVAKFCRAQGKGTVFEAYTVLVRETNKYHKEVAEVAIETIKSHNSFVLTATKQVPERHRIILVAAA